MDTDYLIDENSMLALRLTPNADGHTIHAHLYSKYTQNSKLVHNILPLITLETAGHITNPNSADFDIHIADKNIPLTLKINNHEFASFAIAGEEIKAFPARKLCVFETRMIGRAPQKTIPLPAMDLQDIPMPITDLHTHLSAQVSAKDLIDMGIKHNIAYPTAILDRLGIDYPKDNLTEIIKRPFLPLGIKPAKGEMESAVPLSNLSAQARHALQNTFSYSTETQKTFADMEERYYMREPFTKDIRLFPDMLSNIANAYEAQGITYAELSSNAVTDPEWLKVIHNTLPEIEKNTGVKLRFMAGLPRTLDEDGLDARIELIKRIAESPYIVGVDVFGHEINKTSHLKQPLEKLAKWMHEKRPDLILQIHAGENSKNQKNVKEALQLAKDYDIRVRIIHAVHGVDDETLNLASELSKHRADKVLVAFCPDSNLVLNNIDFPDEVRPFEFMHKDVPTVLASDGADLYRTSTKQIAMAGALCGVTREGFDFIRHTELAHIARQEQIFKTKEAALPHDFFKQSKKPVTASKTEAAKKVIPIKKLPDVNPFTDDCRQPIFIGGAAGSSWEMIRKTDQKEITIGLQLLLERLDPEKTYFVTGRTKDRGVGIELSKAIAHYNATHDKKFDCLLMEAGSQESKVAEGITHRYFIDEPMGAATSAITHYIKQKGGFSLFIGGRQFTRDFIQEASQGDVPFGLMDFINNTHKALFGHDASTEKARIFPDKSFNGAIGMVKYAMNNFSGIFKETVTQSDIQAEYETLKRRSGAAKGE